MGGIWRQMPITYADDVDRLARARRHPDLRRLLLEGPDPGGGLGLTATRSRAMPVSGRGRSRLLTAFYSWRLLCLTFHGRRARGGRGHGARPRDRPKVMTIPLILLAIGATFGGFFGVCSASTTARATSGTDRSSSWPSTSVIEEAHHVPFLIKILPLITGLIGIASPGSATSASPSLPARIATTVPASTASCSTSGTSTSSTTCCSSSPPSGWATASGRWSTSA